jgi:hypothetical protein
MSDFHRGAIFIVAWFSSWRSAPGDDGQNIDASAIVSRSSLHALWVPHSDPAETSVDKRTCTGTNDF